MINDATQKPLDGGSDLLGHNVSVFFDGTLYKPSDNYFLELSYTKTGGWNLWNTEDEKPSLICGHMQGKPFKIEIDGVIVVNCS